MRDEKAKVNLSKINISSFLEKAREKKLAENYEYLITTVGFSAEPSILFIEALKDSLKKVLFIYTKSTEEKIDVIVEYTKLKPSQYDKVRVEKTNMIETYKEIEKFVNRHKQSRKILIDATAGTKPMTAAAILAGIILDLSIWYADYDQYDEASRKPRDKTREYPTKLDNPYKLLGKLELEKAKTYFNSGRFRQAYDILCNLESKLQEEALGEIRALKTLSLAYANWDEFFIENAQNDFKNFEELKKYTNRVDIKQIEKNVESIDKIIKNELWELINFLSAAERNIELKRYDIAVLLTYRTFEYLCTLKLKESGINPSEVSWNDIENKYKGAKNRFAQLVKKIFNTKKVIFKNELGLMEQSILLTAIGNPILENERSIKKMRECTNLRNKSIYAHGKKPLDEGESMEFFEIVKSRVKEYLRQKNLNLDDMLNRIKFPVWK